MTVFIYVVDHILRNLTKKNWLNLSKENLIFFNFCVIFPIVRCSLKGVLVLVLLGLATSLKRVSTSAKFLVIMLLCQSLACMAVHLSTRGGMPPHYHLTRKSMWQFKMPHRQMMWHCQVSNVPCHLLMW